MPVAPFSRPVVARVAPDCQPDPTRVLAGHRRLRSSEDFRLAVRSGVRCATPHLIVHVALVSANPVASTVPTRVGFVVGRSVGGAVVRNRVSRRLRHLTSDRLASLRDGLLIVVRATPLAADATSAALGQDLDRGLQRCVKRLGQRPTTGVGMSQ